MQLSENIFGNKLNVQALILSLEKTFWKPFAKAFRA